jgi:16S rRNA (cytidine1402-2'-O)-methyltransferase
MLFICPTPIGNLGDITLRVVEVLRDADLVACEDTRHTGKLLRHLGLKKELVSFYEENELRRVGYLVERIRAGDDVALVSDAGMPALSDPGYSLVSACLEQGLPVTVLPGASSVTVALVASGLPTDRFTFVGFLPRGAAGKVVSFLEGAGRAGGTVVAFESPRRLPGTLRAIAQRWPERRLAVCRELTKLHEEVLRGTGAEVAERLRDPVRGEVVLVLEPVNSSVEGGRGEAGHPPSSQEEVERALTNLLERGWGARQAASFVAGLAGRSERPVYARALELKRARE